MSIVADFRIPVSGLPGNRIFEELPEAEIEIERIIPTNMAILPFFWVWDENSTKFMEIAREDSNIQSIKSLHHLQDGTLYSATWNPQDTTIHAFNNCSLTIMEGFGTRNGWVFKLRGESREDFMNFQQSFAGTDISPYLQSIHNLREYRKAKHLGLTSKQRETLSLAYEQGYYEEPRKITQQELGDQLGITSRSVSHRLRRGTRQLINKTLISSD